MTIEKEIWILLKGIKVVQSIRLGEGLGTEV